MSKFSGQVVEELQFKKRLIVGVLHAVYRLCSGVTRTIIPKVKKLLTIECYHTFVYKEGVRARLSGRSSFGKE